MSAPSIIVLIDPLVISHGWRESSDFVERNEWQGTRDIAPFLTVPTAVDYQQRAQLGFCPPRVP